MASDSILDSDALALTLAREAAELDAREGARARLHDLVLARLGEALSAHGTLPLAARLASVRITPHARMSESVECAICSRAIAPSDAHAVGWVARITLGDEASLAGLDYLEPACSAHRDDLSSLVRSRAYQATQAAETLTQPHTGAVPLTFVPGLSVWPAESGAGV